MSGANYFGGGGPAKRTGPDYFKDADKPKKANWKKHEKDIAKRSGDRQVSGSGNKPGRPGDVMGGKLLREAKATKRPSITVSPKWMKKLILEALRMNKIPVFEIRIEGAEVPVPKDWVLMPAQDFQDILDA